MKYYIVRHRGVPRKPWWPKDTPKKLQVRPVGQGRWEVCRSAVPPGWIERYAEAYDEFFDTYKSNDKMPFFTLAGLEASGHDLVKEP